MKNFGFYGDFCVLISKTARSNGRPKVRFKDASLFLSKRIGGENRTTKNKIAEEIIKSNSYDRAILDAHYTTHSTIRICHEHNKSYLGKILRNRIVMINGKQGQAQELVKLTKNKKILSVQATFGGIPC